MSCRRRINGGSLFWQPLRIFHPIGTAVMLPKKNGRGVVDPRLVVYGTENLRVADASIILVELSAHI